MRTEKNKYKLFHEGNSTPKYHGEEKKADRHTRLQHVSVTRVCNTPIRRDKESSHQNQNSVCSCAVFHQVLSVMLLSNTS